MEGKVFRVKEIMLVFILLNGFHNAEGFVMHENNYLNRFHKICNKMANSESIHYERLGGSNLEVSKICLGTMTWGEQNNEQEAFDQLNYAIKERGINFIDTAEMYPVPTKPETQGRTDIMIGNWLKTIDRSKIILASKVSGRSDRITWLPGRNGGGSRVNKEQIEVSVDESLKRLGTDYIDLLQIHWPERYVPLFGQDGYDYKLEREYTSFKEQLETLNELIRKGKVRHIGLSNETPYGVMKFSETANKGESDDGKKWSKFISIQNSYSLINRGDFESSLKEVCSPRHENIGLLAYSPLAGGILTGKYAKSDCPKTSRFNLFPGYMSRYKESLCLQAVNEYSRVAEKYQLTPTELALAWCYKQEHVASTIIGATTMTQLRENIDAFEKVELITKDVETDINAVYRRYRDPSKSI